MDMCETVVDFIEAVLENEGMAEELRSNDVVREKLITETSIDDLDPGEVETAFWHLVQKGTIDCDIERWVGYDEIENAYENCLASGYITLNTELIKRVIATSDNPYDPEDFFSPERMEELGWVVADTKKTFKGVEITILPAVNSDADVDKYFADESGDTRDETEAEVYRLAKKHGTTIALGCVIGRPVYE